MNGRCMSSDWDMFSWQMGLPRSELFFFQSSVPATTNCCLASWLQLSPEKKPEYTELVEKLSERFTPAPSEIVELFKFHTRFRKPGESVTSYVSELRSIAKRCNFAATLETIMLRDRIVCGVNDAVIQRRLLSEKELTFKSALEIAQGMESAAQNVRELTTRPDPVLPAPVHHVTDSTRLTNVSYRCGQHGHYAPTCKHKVTVCKKCGKVGHLQKVCRSKRTKPTEQSGSSKSTEQSNAKSKGVNTVVKEGTDEYALLNVTSPGKATPWNVIVDMEGVSVSMQVDTGASLSLMSETTFREYWPQRELVPSEVRLSSYSGESIPVLGSVDVKVTYKCQSFTIPLVIQCQRVWPHIVRS